jgi:hypothetical protein
MQRVLRLSVVLAFVLAFAPMRTESSGIEFSSIASLTPSRLVVFEAFFRPT